MTLRMKTTILTAALLLAVPALPAAAQEETLAKVFAAKREVVSATVQSGAKDTVSVALTARFATEGLSDTEIETMVSVVPYVLARCIAADRAVAQGASTLKTMGAEGDAKKEPWDDAPAVTSAGRYGFSFQDGLAPDGRNIFDATRMRDDCASNDSIPRYDVIGGND